MVRVRWMTWMTISFGALLANAAMGAYPDKPIKIIVPYATGGVTDLRMRTIAEKLAAHLGVSVIIENKSGASGNIGTALIARAKPDGYTIGTGNFAPIAVNRWLYPDLGFDPAHDLEPIGLIELGPITVGVGSKSRFKSIEEMIAVGKKDGIHCANTGVGGASHLSCLLVSEATGSNITGVAYRGGGPIMVDLIAGHVDTYIEQASMFMPYMHAGEHAVRVLASATPKRLDVLPDVPTFKELGYDVVATNWFGLVGPAGMSPEIIGTLNKALNAVLQDQSYKNRVQADGGQVAAGSPEDFRSFIASESKKWGDLIQKNNMTLK